MIGALRAVTVAMLTFSMAAAFGQSATGDELDQEVFWILKSKCAKCHDDLGELAASGVADLLELQSLYEFYLDPSDEELVNDLVLGEDARMPKPNFDGTEWNGPLSQVERDTLKKWLFRGGPSEAYLKSIQSVQREFISSQAVAEQMARDLQRLSGVELSNARYLTLTNLHNNPEVSESDLQTYRAAIVKTLNSLSSAPDVLGLDTSDAIHRLQSIDEHRTIFRFDLRHIGWDARAWDLVAKHYPFALLDHDNSIGAVDKRTSSRLPSLRADWFVFATLQPPLYHRLVGIPDTLAELEESLGIDRFAEIRRGNVARSGMAESKVSEYNRLLERIPFRGGAYHLSYDNGSNDGDSSFVGFPLGPRGLGLAPQFEFSHDGGEAIYNLPNGYQAYMLVDTTGKRLDVAPSAIVQDGSMPRDAIINGISCLSCHFQGMKPERFSPRLAQLDVVRSAASENFVRFDSRDRKLIEELYSDHNVFERLIEEDRARFLEALKASGIPQRGATEPARELFNRFKDDLNTAGLASEFGLSESDFRESMSRETETRQLLAIADKGIFDRQRVFAQYARIARLIGLEQVRDFEVLPFPYYAEDTSQFAHNQAAQSAGNPTIGHTGVDLIDAENKNGRLKAEIWVVDERRSFREGELLEVRIRETESCFLTLISIDASGEMTLLMPNAFHGDFRLRAHETVTIPTPEMTFEFAAKAPHGPTILKAIVTKRPLPIRGVSDQSLAREGLPSLGRAKGFSVRPKARPDQHPVVTEEITESLMIKDIQQQFSADEWSTASWTAVTRP